MNVRADTSETSSNDVASPARVVDQQPPAANKAGWIGALWRCTGLCSLEGRIARRFYAASAKSDIEDQARHLRDLARWNQIALHQIQHALSKLEAKQDTLYAELHEMEFGERQVAPKLSMIRADHTNRYRMAASLVGADDAVLDVGCGVGYGTLLLARSASRGSVLGIDVNDAAITYACRHYPDPRVEYRVGDCLQVDLPRDSFDLATCFELIEHLPQPGELLAHVHGWMKRGGRLLCSTPNEEVVPFGPSQSAFHCRHYTPLEFRELLERANFTVERIAYQNRKRDFEFDDDGERYFMVAVCRKDS